MWHCRADDYHRLFNDSQLDMKNFALLHDLHRLMVVAVSAVCLCSGEESPSYLFLFYSYSVSVEQRQEVAIISTIPHVTIWLGRSASVEDA